MQHIFSNFNFFFHNHIHATMSICIMKVQATHAYRNAWSCWWRWWQWWSICKNSQVPTSINVIVCKWKPLHFVIQYWICNILPLLSLYDFWSGICWTWCRLRLRSIIDNILRSPPPSPYLPPWVEKEAMQSIELDFQMIPINTISFRKQKRFLHVVNVFLNLEDFESHDGFHMEKDQ